MIMHEQFFLFVCVWIMHEQFDEQADTNARPHWDMQSHSTFVFLSILFMA